MNKKAYLTPLLHIIMLGQSTSILAGTNTIVAAPAASNTTEEVNPGNPDEILVLPGTPSDDGIDEY